MAAVVAPLALDPTPTVELLRARVFDRLLGLAAPPLRGGPRIVVIDIDEDSLERLGPWPWRRERIARFDRRCPRRRRRGDRRRYPVCGAGDAIARRAGAPARGRDGRRACARSRRLADRRRRPTCAVAGAGGVALGFALSPEPDDETPPTTPALAKGAIDLGASGPAPGASIRSPLLAAGAALGALSLPGDADGIVRRAPLMVAAGGVLKPGLALETLRLARGASAYLLEPGPARIVSGRHHCRPAARRHVANCPGRARLRDRVGRAGARTSAFP